MDFATALDSVDRGSLWRIMAADRISAKLVKAYYVFTKTNVRAWGGGDSLSFEIHSGVRQGFPFSRTPFNYTIDWILGQALQRYQGVQVGTSVHVSGFAYANEIVLFSGSYMDMQGLFEAVNRHVAAVGMRINALKTKVMSAIIPDEQRQTVLLDGEPLGDVYKFKYRRD